MPPLQIRTTYNTFVQLHQQKHTTKGHGFVDGFRGGGEVHSHITTEQSSSESWQRQKLLHFNYWAIAEN